MDLKKIFLYGAMGWAVSACANQPKSALRSSGSSSSITIEVTPALSTLRVGETTTVSLNTVTNLGIREAVSADSVTWESSDTSVFDPASIKSNDSEFFLTPLNTGTVTLKAVVGDLQWSGDITILAEKLGYISLVAQAKSQCLSNTFDLESVILQVTQFSLGEKGDDGVVAWESVYSSTVGTAFDLAAGTGKLSEQKVKQGYYHLALLKYRAFQYTRSGCVQKELNLLTPVEALFATSEIAAELGQTSDNATTHNIDSIKMQALDSGATETWLSELQNKITIVGTDSPQTDGTTFYLSLNPNYEISGSSCSTVPSSRVRMIKSETPVTCDGTPTSTPTKTATMTPTSTATAGGPTNTPTSTATAGGPTNTPTNTSVSTNTPTNTATNPPANTATNTPSNTPTNSPVNTATNTPTNTATNTPSNTPTNTATSTPTNTPTLTPTTGGGGITAFGGCSVPVTLTLKTGAGTTIGTITWQSAQEWYGPSNPPASQYKLNNSPGGTWLTDIENWTFSAEAVWDCSHTNGYYADYFDYMTGQDIFVWP